MITTEITIRNQQALNLFITNNRSISHVSSRKLVYSVGVNDSDYATKPMVDGKQEICVFYKIWAGMLYRCYSEKFQKRNPWYKGCAVCDEWHSFSNFKAWMKKQDYIGKELDKDILVKGNKIYSPESCIFVTRAINSLLINNKARRGNYAQGVCWNKNIGKFMSQISVGNRVKGLGLFDTEKEAETLYIKHKTANIVKTALEQSSLKLKKALIVYAANMRINFECK